MIRKSQVLTAVAFAMMLPVAAFATQGTTTAAKSTTHHSAVHNAAATKKAPKMPAMDINSASKEDLMKLPGITDELAQKIIDGRPYKMKSDLSKKSILTKAEYAKVRNHIIAKQEKAESKAPESKAPESTTPSTPETGK